MNARDPDTQLLPVWEILVRGEDRIDHTFKSTAEAFHYAVSNTTIDRMQWITLPDGRTYSLLQVPPQSVPRRKR